MAYRKIDVDAFDEDRFLEDEDLIAIAPASSGDDENTVKANLTNVEYNSGLSKAEIENSVDGVIAEARSHLSKGNNATALQILLENPPRGRNASSAKEKSLNAVMEILCSAKPSEIQGYLKGFSLPQIDNLMKYIYLGMAAPQLYQSSSLLQWHEKAFEIGGTGCIVRVLTDRKA